MIRAIIRHIARIIRLMLTAPARTLAALLGTGQQMPPPELVEEIVDEQVEELREDLDTTPVPDAAPFQPLGDRIHEYASADRDARGVFDFMGMPDDVAVTLCVLAQAQLARLAAAGPEACEKWAAGEKGVVGVPLPDASAWTRDAESYAESLSDDSDSQPGLAA